MTDDSGAPLGNDLSDGQEVEILSWRPRSREGVSYEVRRLSDGSEWWIAATYLRRRAAAALTESALAGAAAEGPR